MKRALHVPCHKRGGVSGLRRRKYESARPERRRRKRWFAVWLGKYTPARIAPDGRLGLTALTPLSRAQQRQLHRCDLNDCCHVRNRHEDTEGWASLIQTSKKRHSAPRQPEDKVIEAVRVQVCAIVHPCVPSGEVGAFAFNQPFKLANGLRPHGSAQMLHKVKMKPVKAKFDELRWHRAVFYGRVEERDPFQCSAAVAFRVLPSLVAQPLCEQVSFAESCRCWRVR